MSMKAGIEANVNNSLCLPTSKAKEPTCTFTKGNVVNHIKCNFFDFSPGNYCVRVVDERCKPGILWTPENRECQWAQLRALHNTSPDKPQVNVLSSHAITIFVSILVMTTVVIIIVVLVLRRKRRMLVSPPVQSPEEAMTPMINGIKVLLLYPRDCHELMTVMESFRKVLEAQNIEVFDCHNSEEVLNGPLHWLHRVMCLPDIRTIIVNTQCAYLQEQAILNGCNVSNHSLYKDPIFLDLIFMYGLKVIMEDISSDGYLKNFVIGFDGFSDDEKAISLTSFRRYNVPGHLPRLFVDMNLEFTLESGQLQDSREYIKLLRNIKNLVNYKSMNPHYLDNILNLA